MIAGAAMGIAAVTAAMLGLPLTAVLLTTVFWQADGLALTLLVIVSAVVAYVTAARLVPAPKPEPGQPPAADAALGDLRRSKDVPLARILERPSCSRS